MDDINVSTDLALCRSCGKTFSLSEIVGGSAGCPPFPLVRARQRDQTSPRQLRCYSALSATTGSTRMARREGT
jgi:hypothetical protein